MINLMGAARGYEMNASAIASIKNMIQSAITILG
jgi:flagellar basal body rod protein FlgC